MFHRSAAAAVLLADPADPHVPRAGGRGRAPRPAKSFRLRSCGTFGRLLTNGPPMALVLLIAGFWSMFFQFYGPLPLYLTDDLHASTRALGFVISLDALAIVAAGGGRLLRPREPRGRGGPSSIAALVAAAGSGLHRPGAVDRGRGCRRTSTFSVGEMIYSAHFYRYLGSIAPPDQVGMYMGFAFLPIALGYFLAGLIGGPVYELLQTRSTSRSRGGPSSRRAGVVSALGPLRDDQAAQGRGGRASPLTGSGTAGAAFSISTRSSIRIASP